VQPAPETDAATDIAPQGGRTRARRQPSWRSGSSTAEPWNLRLLLIAIIGLGAGIAVSSFAESAFLAAGWVVRTAIWAGMAVPIVIAFARSRPRALLHFRPQDLLYGFAVGIVLRLAQGWLEVAAGGSTGFPSLPLIGEQVPADIWFTYGLSPVVIAPLLEEFFFRGVVLVSVFVVLRSNYRRSTALFAASVVSVALFVIAHTVTITSTWDEIASLALLGAACAAMVATTGRIWGAVITHVVYNLIFAALAVAGTIG
jgi:membrane protease YdiL (CAAX protease family)